MSHTFTSAGGAVRSRPAGAARLLHAARQALGMICLLPLLGGIAPALAQPASVHALWQLRANNWPGTLDLVQAADGSLSGWMYGEPVRGYYAAAQGTLALLRGQPGAETQAFWGTVDASGQVLRGEFHGLNGSTSGASTAFNRYAWEARLGAAVPTTPVQGLPPAGQPGPQSMAGSHWVYTSANGTLVPRPNTMSLTQQTDGALSGSYQGAPLRGFYAAGEGRVVLVRGPAQAPEALHVGVVDLSRAPALPSLVGAVHPLSASAAAQLAAVPASWGINPRLVASMGGRWNLDGNGWPGLLNLQQDPDGRVSGFMYGERVVGYYAPGERTAVLLRGPEGRPTQAFIGQLAADGLTWSGVFHALSTVGGGSAGGNRFAFAARRAPLAPPPVAVGSAFGGGAACIHQAYSLTHAATLSPALRPAQVWFGSGAALCPTDTLFGRSSGEAVQTFVSQTGTAWVRFAGSEPAQLYVGTSDHTATEFVQGQVVVGRMTGKVYLLSAAAGATPTSMTHTFGANLCWGCPP